MLGRTLRQRKQNLHINTSGDEWFMNLIERLYLATNILTV